MKCLYVCHAAPPWFRPQAGAEAVKVGVSKNPFRRKWGVRRPGCDFPTLVWESQPLEAAYQIETMVKRRLAHRCVGGTEWFDVKPATAIRHIQRAIRDYAACVAKSEVSGIGVRTIYRRLGPKNTPSFGRKK